MPNGRYSDPVIAGTNVYISDGLTTLFALDTATGRPQWQFKSTYYGPYPDCSPATVLDDTVYICAGGAVWALDPATGAQRWSTPIPGGTYGAPVIAIGENVYVTASATRPKDPGLHVLEAATGAQRWTVPTQPGSLPVVVGDNVYIATGSVPLATNGGLDALDAATGTQHWTTSNRSLTPIYGNGDTLVCIQRANLPQTMSGLRAIDARTGSMRWQSQFWPAGPVGIAGGIAYFIESANGLYALNL